MFRVTPIKERPNIIDEFSLFPGTSTFRFSISTVDPGYNQRQRNYIFTCGFKKELNWQSGPKYALTIGGGISYSGFLYPLFYILFYILYILIAGSTVFTKFHVFIGVFSLEEKSPTITVGRFFSVHSEWSTFIVGAFLRKRVDYSHGFLSVFFKTT